ncbi:MAG: mobilization protein [Polyangiaceae bacterium]
MSHIHFVGGEKGGVGKSLVARLLCQWFIDRSAPFAAIDADVSHATLRRAYGSYAQPADLDDFASADEIIDRAFAADRAVVVDLPAQSKRALDRWLASADVLRFAREAGIRLTLWHVSDGTVDSVNDLERTLERYGDALAYIAVRNHGRGKDFTLFDESDARRRLLERGGRVIDLPELDAVTMTRVDRTGVSLWAAANNTEGDQTLAPLQRQRARMWLERSYAALGSLGDAL